MCWFVGHDIMTTSAAHRVCLRCGQKEKKRNLGHVEAWVEVAPVTKPVSDEP